MTLYHPEMGCQPHIGAIRHDGRAMKNVRRCPCHDLKHCDCIVTQLPLLLEGSRSLGFRDFGFGVQGFTV